MVIRQKHERSQEPVHTDVIREVAKAVSIPVIANGVSAMVKTFEDIDKCRQETACSSVMLARAAQWNPSVFRYTVKGAKPQGFHRFFGLNCSEINGRQLNQ